MDSLPLGNALFMIFTSQSLRSLRSRVMTNFQSSVFSDAPRIPKDAIFALTAQYQNDSSPIKVNLGQGTYRDGEGRPWVLPSVAEARRRILSQGLDHEYLPILGHPQFRQATSKLVLGQSAFVKLSSRIANTQSLSGTGGLHLAAQLIRSCSSLTRDVYVPEPTWSNHHLVFSSLGFNCHSFPYYDFTKRAIDFESYKSMLLSATPGSVVILHACAHNPTGCDPSKDQWAQIGEIMKERQLFPLFDAAYLGFNSGDYDEDAYAIRLFANDLGMECLVSLSFAKNMGLYGERSGCTMLIAASETIASNCESVMERLQRAEISNPPAFGAKIASAILNDPDLTKMWYGDLKTMCGRIRDMRQSLYDKLTNNGTPGDWSHIVKQSGMFSFLGLSPEIVTQLKDQYHIYMADNSRISLAGLNKSNVAYVAKSISECVGSEKKDGTSAEVLRSSRL